MAGDATDLIGPQEHAFSLELTPAQLKVVHTALKAMADGFGHDERDVHRVIRQVLDKLPDEASIRAIDFAAEIRRATSA